MVGVSSHSMVALAPSMADQTGGRILRDDLAVVEDGDAVAERLRLVHEVRGEEDGLAALAQA